MSLMIPRNHLDRTSSTTEMNLRHFSSEIIVVKISRLFARFTDSNSSDCETTSKSFSINVFEFISMFFTECPNLHPAVISC